jgi:hypothetical protein
MEYIKAERERIIVTELANFIFFILLKLKLLKIKHSISSFKK